MQYLLSDPSVLILFAKAHELNLLEQCLGGSARVTEAVAQQIDDATLTVPALREFDSHQWFGNPIGISGRKNTQRIEDDRIAIFGGSRKRPLEYLGESQTYHLTTRDPEFNEAIWISEDRAVQGFARQRALPRRDCFDILCDLVSSFGLPTKDAMRVSKSLHATGEPVLRVAQHRRDFRV